MMSTMTGHPATAFSSFQLPLCWHLSTESQALLLQIALGSNRLALQDNFHFYLSLLLLVCQFSSLSFSEFSTDQLSYLTHCTPPTQATCQHQLDKADPGLHPDPMNLGSAVGQSTLPGG